MPRCTHHMILRILIAAITINLSRNAFRIPPFFLFPFHGCAIERSYHRLFINQILAPSSNVSTAHEGRPTQGSVCYLATQVTPKKNSGVDLRDSPTEANILMQARWNSRLQNAILNITGCHRTGPPRCKALLLEPSTSVQHPRNADS